MERMTYSELIQYCNDHGYEYYTEMPDGWTRVLGTTTAPRGTTWIQNIPSPLSKGRKVDLLIMVQKDE